MDTEKAGDNHKCGGTREARRTLPLEWLRILLKSVLLASHIRTRQPDVSARQLSYI